MVVGPEFRFILPLDWNPVLVHVPGRMSEQVIAPEDGIDDEPASSLAAAWPPEFRKEGVMPENITWPVSFAVPATRSSVS